MNDIIRRGDSLRTFLLGRPRSPWLRAARLVPAAAIMVAILVFSASSDTPGGRLAVRMLGPSGSNNRNVHAITYSFLAVALVWGVWPMFRNARWAFLFAWVIATAYGGLDELHQMLVPRRACSLEDCVTDAVGALAGCAIAAAIRAVVRHLRPRSWHATG